MAFPKYIAWLNGDSVAVGTRKEVERKAREIAASPRFREWLPPDGHVKLKITTYGAQRFVEAYEL